MKKKVKQRGNLKQELIDAILNEDNKFDMSVFKSGAPGTVATCGTARCMAGHIVALRPGRAKELATPSPWGARPYVNYEAVARRIWEEETGEECRLDFYGYFKASRGRVPLSDATRTEAVAHIRGKSKRWPLQPEGWTR